MKLRLICIECDRCNIYIKNNSKSKIIGYILHNEEIEIEKETDNFYKIKNNNGYVKKKIKNHNYKIKWTNIKNDNYVLDKLYEYKSDYHNYYTSNKPSNHNKIWTPNELVRLCEFIKKGKNMNELTKIFSRTNNSIKRKMEKLADPILDKYRKISKIKNNVFLNEPKNSYECSILFCIGMCDINLIKKHTNKSIENIQTVYTKIQNNIKESNKDNIDNYSMKAIKWIEDLMKTKKIYIQHAGNNSEYCVNGTMFRADGYCESTNTIYEFYGCYYHGCKKCFSNKIYCFSELDKHKRNIDLYNETIIREKIIKEKGYNIVSIWECEFDNKFGNDFSNKDKNGYIIDDNFKDENGICNLCNDFACRCMGSSSENYDICLETYFQANR